ncbi:MAG: hypothetical protein HN683_20695, partial [Gammaproteobacteria bacterium]|nr:hypothetical protein [Gammaproteobacteria bacterium]
VDCLAFHTGDFAIDIDADCHAMVCLRSGNALSVSGYKATDDCCAVGVDRQAFRNVNDLQFGSGFRITELGVGGDGECCVPGEKGSLQIEVCTPKVSGRACEIATDYACTGYECLSFSTGDFALSFDDDCNATVCMRSGNALSISGYDAYGDCCETSGPLKEFPNIGNLQFGDGFRLEEITAGKDGECCVPGEKGGLKIDVCIPKISGLLAATEGYLPSSNICCGEDYSTLDCHPYECLVFDPDSFKVAYDKDTCAAHVYTCQTQISGADCQFNKIPCTGFDCLGFNTGDFALIFDDDTCDATVCLRSGNALSVSGYKATDDCCAVGVDRQAFRNVNDLQFGSGFRITELGVGGDGECCVPGEKGSLQIEVCLPKVSGVDCNDYKIDCTGYECLAFHEDDFRLAVDEDCNIKVCATKHALHITGYTAGDYDCCGGSVEDDWQNIQSLKFGSGFKITPETVGEDGECCEPGKAGSLAIDICMPKISGWKSKSVYDGEDISCCEAPTDRLPCTGYECLAFDSGFLIDYNDETCTATVSTCAPMVSGADCYKEVVNCTGFSCLAFNTGDFALDVNNDCEATVCIRSGNTLSVSGYESSYDCCENEGSLTSYPNVGSLEFGSGFRIDSIAGGVGGECCEPGQKGVLKIDVCTPKVSGATCDPEVKIDCSGYECLGFNTGDFALELDDDCNATVC